MAILDILTYPDPRLHRKALPVAAVNQEVRKLIDDMAETMYAAPGVGLAAVQVDVLKRVVVIDVSEDKQQLLALVNPEIVRREGNVVCEEGCLSVPGIYDKVERAEFITVNALDRDGKSISLDAEGLLAVCVQHELDHLEGKVFVEYLSGLKQQRIRTKLRKRERSSA